MNRSNSLLLWCNMPKFYFSSVQKKKIEKKVEFGQKFKPCHHSSLLLSVQTNMANIEWCSIQLQQQQKTRLLLLLMWMMMKNIYIVSWLSHQTVDYKFFMRLEYFYSQKVWLWQKFFVAYQGCENVWTYF